MKTAITIKNPTDSVTPPPPSGLANSAVKLTTKNLVSLLFITALLFASCGGGDEVDDNTSSNGNGDNGSGAKISVSGADVYYYDDENGNYTAIPANTSGKVYADIEGLNDEVGAEVGSISGGKLSFELPNDSSFIAKYGLITVTEMFSDTTYTSKPTVSPSDAKMLLADGIGVRLGSELIDLYYGNETVYSAYLYLDKPTTIKGTSTQIYSYSGGSETYSSTWDCTFNKGWNTVYSVGRTITTTKPAGTLRWYIILYHDGGYGSGTHGDFQYTYTTTEVTITRYTGSGGAVAIPSTINEKPVTTIGFGAFDNKQLTSVTIPNSVTYIGNSAFSNNRLINVTIPNSVTTIGDSAFSSNRLTSVTISNSITSIGKNVFSNNQLTSITIPNSVTAIGDSAFYSNELTSVNIPNSVTSIGERAFSGNRLTSVTISNSVTSIGKEVFSNNQLTSVAIPNSVTAIWERAFSGNRLTSVTIPNSVTTIWDYAFAYNQLVSVTIPNSVTYIGNSAFENNELTSVTIPNSVTSIGKGVFAGNNLTSVTIGPNVALDSSFGYSSGDLDEVYNNGGKQAGTYTRNDNDYTWSKQ